MRTVLRLIAITLAAKIEGHQLAMMSGGRQAVVGVGRALQVQQSRTADPKTRGTVRKPIHSFDSDNHHHHQQHLRVLELLTVRIHGQQPVSSKLRIEATK